MRATPRLNAAVEDAALASALIAGDRDATLLAWKRFAPMVYRILKRTFGSVSDVEDLQQDIFLAFFRKVPGLRDPKALEAFVGAITSRMIKYEFRRRKHSFVSSWGAHADPSGEQDVPDQAAADIPARQALSAFYEVLDQLTAKDKMLFSLRFIDGLNLPQIAEAAGISISTTKRQLARIRKVVGKRIKKSPELLDYASRAKARSTRRKPWRTSALAVKESAGAARHD